ncbi:MAG: hypothetical protein GQ470_00955 [Gammaproteobacteria bacterium]|nr:hypothetical protein [Gammaproteobacteria bacterium]
MKTIKLTAVMVLALGTIACGSSPVKDAPADCVFPNTEKSAPGWICDEPQAGLDIQAVGIAEPSKGGISFMKNLAAADARGRLAEQFKVKVSKMVKIYLGNTGGGDTETVDAAAESAVKSISNETLIGSKVYKSRTGPTGRLFVLMGLDEAAAKKSSEVAVSTSMKNDKALWQKFMAAKSFDEMRADIANTQID